MCVSLCVSARVYWRANEAAFSEGLSKYSLQFNVVFAAAACCSPHYPYEHNPGAADPSPVSVGVQEMQSRGAQMEEREVDVKKKKRFASQLYKKKGTWERERNTDKEAGTATNKRSKGTEWWAKSLGWR